MADPFDRSLTEGPLRAALVRIAWPTVLVHLTGALQGIVDHLMVGRFAGYQANAAVAVGWQIFALFVVFIASLCSGLGILIGRLAGAGDRESVDRAFTQTCLVSAVLSLGVFAPVGYLWAPSLLAWTHATAPVQAEALSYLRFLFLSNTGLVLFFLVSSALRAAGDARTPMRLTFLMTALNVVLTAVLVPGLGPVPALGVRGAAIATATSGLAVAAVSLYLLVRGRLLIRFAGLGNVASAIGLIREVLRFGLPMGFQGIAINLGNVLLLRFLGSLEKSAEAQSVYAIAYSQIFLVVHLISSALMTASATVTGHSLGARRPDRAARVPSAALRIALAINAPLVLAILSFPEALLGLFGLEDSEILAMGRELLFILSLASFFSTAAFIYIGVLEGAGDTKSALMITVVSQVALPLGILALLEQISALSSSRIWLAIAVGHVARSFLSFLRFRKGEWRKIDIKIGVRSA